MILLERSLSFIGSISDPKATDDNAQTLFKMIMRLIEKLFEQIMNIKESKRS